MSEYTYSDVIVDPEDPRVEIGKEYYFGDNVGALLHGARTGWTTGVLCDVGKVTDEYSPFYNGSSGFSCIIRKKKLSYVERQTKWIVDNDVKKGDKVRVVRKADDNEDGWDNSWNQNMDKAVGKIGTVCFLPDYFEETGIEINVPESGCFSYPYFVLEKVEEKRIPYDFKDPECRSILVGKVVRYKLGDACGPVMITGFKQLESGGWIAYLGDRNVTDAEELLNHCENIDGTPCGRLVEEVQNE